MSKWLTLEQVKTVTAVVVRGYDKTSTFGMLFRIRPHRFNRQVTRLLVMLPLGCEFWKLDYKDKKRILEILKINEDSNKVIWMTPACFLPQDTKHGWITCQYSGNDFFYFLKGDDAVTHERRANLVDGKVALNNGQPATMLNMKDIRGKELPSWHEVLGLILIVLGLLFLIELIVKQT